MRLSVSLWMLILAYWGATLALHARSHLEPALHGWLEGAEVGNPRVVDNLAVYPIQGRMLELPRRLSLDAALMQRVLVVQELRNGEVNRLSVENTGERPVYIMAGEVLTGAKQDRVLQHDLWLPGGSCAEVSAYCVEHGRWSYKGDKRFRSDGAISNARVRLAARSEGGQDAVWASVAETNRSARVASPTGALQAVYEDPRMAAQIRRMVEDLADMPAENPEMNGVAIQVGGRVVAIDVFPDRALLLSLWPKLCRSYALEARSLNVDLDDTDRSKVQSLLGQAAALDVRALAQEGQGQLYAMRGSALDGEALVLHGELVHMELLSKEKPNGPPRRTGEPWPPAIDLVRPRR